MTHNSEIAVLDEERSFHIDELFFSTTDQRGVIRHGNEVFSRIAGYDPSELYGTPHSIIRHPDMPRVVFKLLWDTIKSGKTIAAYVKNLAKDGRYYWVLAVVMPCEEGYLSIRLKPSSDLLPVVKDLYTKLLSIERTIEAGPKQRPAAMQAAAEELNRQLASLRFASYDEFMLHALSVEIASRQKLMKSADVPVRHATHTTTNAAFADLIFRQQDCREVDKQLQAMFVGLDQFKAMSQQLTTHSRVVMRSADSIRTLSMNATISAGKLGQKGATLQVVAQSLGSVSLDSERLIDELTRDMTSVVSVLNQLVFDVAATKLQTEIILQFLDEIRNSANVELDHRLEESLRILFEQVSIRVEKVFDHLRQTEQRILDLSAQLEKLNRNNRTLRFVQFAGQKESSICEEAVNFAVVFDNVRSHIDHTDAECETLGASILEVLQCVRTLQKQHDRISARLAGMRDLVTAGA